MTPTTEHLTPEEQENLRAFWRVRTREFYQELDRPVNIPIQDYCDEHFGQQYGGGWRCAVCWQQQQEASQC